MHYHTTRDKQLEYISKMSVELKKMAQNADEAFLSLLLDMAAMEARRCLPANEALTSPQPDHATLAGHATPAHQ